METIKVKHEVVEGNDLGFVVIDKADFDPKIHEEFIEEVSTGDKALEELNGQELKEWLTANGVEHKGNISKVDALALAVAKRTELEAATQV